MDMKYISFVMSNCDVVTFPLVYIWSGQESVMDGLADGGGLKKLYKTPWVHKKYKQLC